MSGDDDIDLPVTQLPGNLALPGRRSETREHLHLYRKWGEALAESCVVLLGQNRRRHQHGHLLAVQYGLEGGAQSYFGLAVTHIATDEAVHRRRLFHVLLDLVDHAQLILGFLVGKSSLQFGLPLGVGWERMAGDRFASGVQVQKFLGQFVGRALGSGLRLVPTAVAQAIKRRVYSIWTDPFAQPVGVVHRYVERVAVGIGHQQVLSFHPAQVTNDQALEPADAVVEMHDVVPLFDICEERLRGRRPRAALPPGGGAAPAENLCVR